MSTSLLYMQKRNTRKPHTVRTTMAKLVGSLTFVRRGLFIILLLLEAGLIVSAGKNDYHGFPTSLLFHAPDNDVCNSSSLTTNTKTRASIVVAYKHGPCSPLSQTALSPTRVLADDKARADSIQGKISGRNRRFQNSEVLLPAKSGVTIGSGNFIATFGLGTPVHYFSLIFDTGSDLTWTQCRPCSGACYNQKEVIFNPVASSSYSNITCQSDTCSEIASSTGRSPSCSGSTCVYSIRYGDKSSSVGFLARDKLTLSPTNIFEGFLFGCGENNQGLFGGAAGLLGLGRQTVSIVLQTAEKYGKSFSYCLPSNSRSTGHLTFGSAGGGMRNVRYTPMLSDSREKTFYFLDVIGISVGGTQLAVKMSVFSEGGTIIDSGTVISRLPFTAYAALRAEFRQQMSDYPTAERVSILDTCYDLSRESSVSVPKISFVFRGGAEMPVSSSGILYPVSSSTACLAFASNGDDNSVGIIGNSQQQTLEVVYDVVQERVGFAPGGCT